MTRQPRRKYPNIVAVADPRTGQPKGWRAQVWINRRLHRSPQRVTQEEAHEDAKGLLDLRDRITGGDDNDIDLTFERAIQRVLTHLDVKDRRAGTKQWFATQFRCLLKEWPGDTLLRKIGRQQVQAWIHTRIRAVSANTIHHNLRALRRVFRMANLPSPTSDARLVVPDQTHARIVVPTWESVQEMLAYVHADDPAAWGTFGLFAYTGIRRGEAARLRVEDIDFATRTLWIQHAKVAKQPRSLPMPQGLMEMAKKSLRGNEWVFPGPHELARERFLSKLASTWKVRLHSLRHAFASELANRHVPVHLISILLGHSLPGITGRYVHAALPELRQAMECLWP